LATALPIYTIGHSTRSAEEFLSLLLANSIERLVDVRQFPGSRRFPHFARESMNQWLPAAGIEYRHEVDLGGRRRPQPNSPHTYWTNPSFRAYADYMETPAYQAALARLIELGRDRRTTVMCSEAVPWRCHRKLIADSLVVAGVEVEHILENRLDRHALNPHARVVDGQLIYDRVEPWQATLF
jgi:uncharacterized protein (DUF488 family)